MSLFSSLIVLTNKSSDLATKVTFFNELYKMYKSQGCEASYEEFAEMVGLDERIGQSHTQVPGQDGKFGWDSHCFNKDLYELEKFGGSSLIKFIRELNTEHRSIDT